MMSRGEYDAWKLASDDVGDIEQDEAFLAGAEYRMSEGKEHTPNNPPKLSDDPIKQKYLERQWIAGWCDADMTLIAEGKVR